MATKKTAAAPKLTGLRYLGIGFLPGLPARDLNAAELVEYEAIITEMEQAGTLGLLYEPVEEPVTEEGATNA